MPIPNLTAHGVLPDGLHECTLEEVAAVFGTFNTSDRRPRLLRDFERYLSELRSSGLGKFLVVNGSFVTAKPDPGDIDVLLVLHDGVDLAGSVPPFEYNMRSRKYVKKEYGLDFYVGFENDPSSLKMIEVFQNDRNRPGQQKGVLKIAL